MRLSSFKIIWHAPVIPLPHLIKGCWSFYKSRPCRELLIDHMVDVEVSIIGAASDVGPRCLEVCSLKENTDGLFMIPVKNKTALSAEPPQHNLTNSYRRHPPHHNLNSYRRQPPHHILTNSYRRQPPQHNLNSYRRQPPHLNKHSYRRHPPHHNLNSYRRQPPHHILTNTHTGVNHHITS